MKSQVAAEQPWPETSSSVALSEQVLTRAQVLLGILYPTRLKSLWSAADLAALQLRSDATGPG